MVEPPDLSAPFKNENERGTWLAELLQFSAQLDRWRELALSPETLTPARRADLAMAAVPGDSPESKLTRWANLFDDELQAVIDARNRAVHGVRIGDRELRGAVWLARQLLDLIEPPAAA